MKALIGIKKGMTRVFKDDKIVPVTVIDTEGCILSFLEPKGFELGIGEKRNPSKAMAGKYKEAGKVPHQRRYFKGTLDGDLKIGSEVKASEFNADDEVTITGVSKGKGFAGVVKRWHFAGGPKTHGQSDKWRAPGAIGQRSTPGRVYKGLHMAGRMGGNTITLEGRKIVGVKDNLVMIAGPLPGANGDIIAIHTK